MHILDAFLSSIRKIAKFNPDVQVAPACILWPDSERQFENVIPQLQEAMPELLVLGDYAPDRRTGPAIWIRCALDGRVPNFNPCKKIPIVYMPGVSRASMRLVEAYPTGIKALAYYQYRGIFFSQVSAKDWTILAFLKSSDGGLGLDVATDEACKNAMQLSFPLLLNQEVGLLQGKHLDKDFFNTLISGGDPVKEILQWLNEGDSWRTRKSEIQWQAFVELCKSNYAFDPELDGRSKGLELFANRLGVWGPVFDRYAESYTTYRSIHKVLEEQPGPDFDLFGSAEEYGGWPQWNEREENNLLRDLESLTQLTVKEATVRLSELEQCHSIRRNLVWSRQGKAPLAAALAELMKLARLSQEGFFANSVQELGCYYEQQGYQVDLTAWKSIANLKNRKNRDTVKKVIRLFYQPGWKRPAIGCRNCSKRKDIPHRRIIRPQKTVGSVIFLWTGCVLISPAKSPIV